VRAPPRPLLLLVAAGGVVGALARYGLVETLTTGAHGVPWVTFGVNLSGAFALGFFSTLAPADAHRSRAFVAVGVLGAYTTFSTLAMETVLLMRAGRVGVGFSYLAATIVFGLGTAKLGIWCARVVRPRVA
jgi:CrcB protein